MEIEGIIFDLDGTLVNTIEDIGDAANVMLKRKGLPLHTTDEYVKWIGNGAVKLIENALGPGVDPDQLMPCVTRFRELYSKNLHNKSRLYEGIPELLDELTSRGMKLSVLSNKPHPFTGQVASFYLSGWDFYPVFGQRESVPLKPDPTAALEIADILKIKRDKTLLVGDSLGDLKTAEAAGMIPVGVSWGYGRLGTIVQNGHCLIHDPMELIKLLKR